MRDVTLLDIYEHPITQKYLNGSGMAHAIAVAYHAFHLAGNIMLILTLRQKLVSYMIWATLLGIVVMGIGIMSFIVKMISIPLKVQKEHISY